MHARTKAFLLVTGLSSAGSGLIYPLTTIYLQRSRHFNLWVTSAYFVVLAGMGLMVSLLTGAAIDRYGAKLPATLGIAAEGTGMCLLAGAVRPWLALATAALIGAGNSIFFTALSPVLTDLESGPQLDRAFAIRYWFLNLGAGLGLLVGATAITRVGEQVYGSLFLLNGLTSLTFAAVIMVVVPGGIRPEPTEHRAGLRWLLADPPLVVLLVAQVITVAFGFALFESVVPAVVVLGAGDSGALASVIGLSSVVVVVAAQMPAARWMTARRRTAVLQIQAALWAAAAILMAIAYQHHDVPSWVAIVYGALFGLGECLYAVAFKSLVARAVPNAFQGRYNGAISLAYGIGLIVGPPVGLWAFARSTGFFWCLTAAACLLATALWRWVAPIEARPEAASRQKQVAS